MDHFKFVQFCHKLNLRCPTDKKLDLLKELDVDYCIPLIPQKMKHWINFPGYTYLHVAVAKNNIEIVDELIKQGANVLKQGTENGITPIHLVINKTLDKNRCLQWMHRHQDHELARKLLSVHVSTNNSTNPKCKEGLSHFHIACIVDHTNAVEFFLKAGEPIDQKVTSTTHSLSGYTPLHCSVKYLCMKSTEILLAHGADVHLKNVKGKSPLHLLTERLIKVADLITIGKREIRCHYDTKIEKIETMIDCILKNRLINGADFIDDIGLTGFHVACMLKDMSIVTHLFEKGIDIDKAVNSNSNLWPGWTPLHFAACTNVETFKFLVKNGANISAKNAQGETSLDFCSMRYAPKILHSILSIEEKFNNIMLSDGSTKLLDLLIAMNNRDSFAKFLQNLTDVGISVAIDSPIWPGYSLLHLSLIMNEKTKYKPLFPGGHTIDMYERPEEDYNCTKSEETVYMERIEMCLTKGCSVSVKNAEGLSPIHLAFKLRKKKALEVLLTACNEDVVGPNDLSHLHIACFANRLELVELLLKTGSNVNSSIKESFHWRKMSNSAELIALNRQPTPIEILVRAHSTPLHIAVSMENVDLIERLLQADADVYARDDLEQSPIHLSIEACISGTVVAQSLIRATSNLVDCISKNGLSHLHVAAFADEQEAVDKLLQGGASVDQRIQQDSSFIGETPLHIAVKMKSVKAVDSLLRGGANVHAAHLTRKFSSPLQYAIDNYDHKIMGCIIRKLIEEHHGIGAVDESGLTLLHLACALGTSSLAGYLLQFGADPNAQIRDDEEYEGKWKGKRPLHVLVCETSTAGVSMDIAQVAMLLLQYGADVTMKDLDSTPLHIIYNILHGGFSFTNIVTHNETAKTLVLDVGDLLLKNQKSYDVNPLDDHGISHFHYACSRSDLEIMKKFLDAGVDVNEMINPFAKRNAGKTPLHFSLAFGQKEAALFLIENGADVKAKDVEGNTPLHALHGKFYMDLDLIDVLLKHGADINAKNLSSETPLGEFLKNPASTLTLEIFTFFLNRGYKIDLYENGEYNEGIIGEIMRHADPDESQTIFKTLLEACNLKDAIKEGFNAIINFVSIHQFGQISVEDYVDIIERFMEMGSDIDGLNDEGNTALYEAAECWNVEAIEALLLLGADINVNDMRYFYHLSVDEYLKVALSQQAEVAKVLTDHIWKSKLVNVNNCENIDDSPRSFEKLYPLDNETKQRFTLELIEMENTYIIESLSVKDFMSDLGAVAAYPRMLAAQRQAVDEFFRCRADLRKKFPEYCGLLLVQYKKLLARLELLQPARDALSRLCPIELPHLCAEAILRYLTNDDLKNLAQVCALLQNIN